jgi:hypothetical protein
VTFSNTASRTDTYSEARVGVVMLGADFYCLAGAGLISAEAANKWTEDLSHILLRKAAKGFQIQLKCQGYSPVALDYRVSSDGSLLESGTAGGINYFALPHGTSASLFVDLNYGATKIAAVREYLRGRGWGLNGHAVEGPTVRDRAYSKDQYGVVRSKVGAWP